MTLRIIVAGCRYYDNYIEAKKYIDEIIRPLKSENILIFLSGGCRGADLLGEKYAKEKGYELEYYPAQWERYGRAAGPIRNKEMVQNADYVICFWDKKSKGTKSLINYCNKLNKPVFVKNI